MDESNKRSLFSDVYLIYSLVAIGDYEYHG